MDLRDRLVEVLPHYLVVAAMLIGALTALRAYYGDLGLWWELTVVLAIVLLYPPIVRRLGLAPRSWER